MIRILESLLGKHIEAIPSSCCCSAVVIGVVGASAYLLNKGVKYIIGEIHLDANLKGCKEVL